MTAENGCRRRRRAGGTLCAATGLLLALAPNAAYPDPEGSVPSTPGWYRAGDGQPSPAPATRPALRKGVLLIANRELNDPNFYHSVVLITHYDESGTTGVIINRPLDLEAMEVLPPLGDLETAAGKLHMGGPVAVTSLQILVRTESPVDAAMNVFDDVYLVGGSSMLRELLDGTIESSALKLYAGHAGWAAGQLETELLRGDWYLWHADTEDLFGKPAESVWPDLIALVTARWVRLETGLPSLAPVSRGGIMSPPATPLPAL